MALYDFRELPFGLQIGLLLRDATPLLSRSEGRQQWVLFSLHTYYVETGWDEAGHIESLRSFTNTSRLEPYLDQLDWHKLT